MDGKGYRCVAALGPEGTFSELAAIKYSSLKAHGPEISLYPTIRKVFDSIGQQCGVGIVPIENMSEGYVQPTLDLLLRARLKIINEMVLPVRFSFVSFAESLDSVHEVYAQFVAQGQCQNFLDKMVNAHIVTTSSNTEALPLVKKENPTLGAIVPSHCIRHESAYHLVISDIADFKNNETRFLVLGTEDCPYEEGKRYKTSIAVVHVPDKPGMLSAILSILARHKLNLTSIMSRPTKEGLGKYLFYMDIDGHFKDGALESAFREIRNSCEIIIFGSYTLLS